MERLRLEDKDGGNCRKEADKEEMEKWNQVKDRKKKENTESRIKRVKVCPGSRVL